jgi:succinyl-CoA synthetase alpha subunit
MSHSALTLINAIHPESNCTTILNSKIFTDYQEEFSQKSAIFSVFFVNLTNLTVQQFLKLEILAQTHQ